MKEIKEIENKVREENIISEWSLFEDLQGSRFEFKFYKEHFKCEFKCSKWDLEKNTSNITKIVLDYFENCKMLLTGK